MLHLRVCKADRGCVTLGVFLQPLDQGATAVARTANRERVVGLVEHSRPPIFDGRARNSFFLPVNCSIKSIISVTAFTYANGAIKRESRGGEPKNRYRIKEDVNTV